MAQLIGDWRPCLVELYPAPAHQVLDTVNGWGTSEALAQADVYRAFDEVMAAVVLEHRLTAFPEVTIIRVTQGSVEAFPEMMLISLKMAFQYELPTG